MEKLIELLNERQQSFTPGYEFTYKYGEESAKEDLNKLSQLKLFIKWLVENDKIDRDKKETEKSDYDITFTGALTMDKKSDLDIMVDTLLMLLSISSSPIEDLISYLK